MKVPKCIKWIKVSERLPFVNEDDKFDQENDISVRVLIRMGGDPFSEGIRFARYHWGRKNFWSVEGITGFEQKHITHFAFINEP